MDVISETFPKSYFQRIIRKGIALVAEEKSQIIGVCFGTYRKKEKWADLLGLAINKKFRNKGIGKELVIKFEKIVRRKELKTIDLYSGKNNIKFYKNLDIKRERLILLFVSYFNLIKKHFRDPCGFAPKLPSKLNFPRQTCAFLQLLIFHSRPE